VLEGRNFDCLKIAPPEQTGNAVLSGADRIKWPKPPVPEVENKFIFFPFLCGAHDSTITLQTDYCRFDFPNLHPPYSWRWVPGEGFHEDLNRWNTTDIPSSLSLRFESAIFG
jgi:hypothetical protein